MLTYPEIIILVEIDLLQIPNEAHAPLLGDGTLGPIFCPFALLGFNRNVGHGANFC